MAKVTLGLACIREAFSSRIYVADAGRDSVFAYFKKRGMTAFFKDMVDCHMSIFYFVTQYEKIFDCLKGYFVP